MNVRGDTTKPVENVRWAKGKARTGRYRVYVQNYVFHEQEPRPMPYKVELEVNGEVRHFEETISPGGQTHDASNVVIAEFDYALAPVHAGAAGPPRRPIRTRATATR
jgi:hypothetical protein